MSYISTIPVTEMETSLMNGVGFKQVPGPSPYAWWNNSKGREVYYDVKHPPYTIEDVLELVYCSAYNIGAQEQKQDILNKATYVVSQFLDGMNSKFQTPLTTNWSNKKCAV